METFYCLEIFRGTDEMGFCLSYFSDLQYRDVCATYFPVCLSSQRHCKGGKCFHPSLFPLRLREGSRFISPKLIHLIKVPELGAWSPVFSRETTFSQGPLKWWLSPCWLSLVFLQFSFGQRCLFVPVFFLVAC